MARKLSSVLQGGKYSKMKIQTGININKKNYLYNNRVIYTKRAIDLNVTLADPT